MSTWLELGNDLKRRYSVSYLTVTQQAAYNALLDDLRGPHWVNLYGPRGNGKTLLAWLVARAIGLRYIAWPHELRGQASAPDGLIIDNAPATEVGARAILAECGLLNCMTVLLVTQRPIAMPMRRIESLLPTTDDIQAVIQTLTRLGYVCNQHLLPSQPSYWDVLVACV